MKSSTAIFMGESQEIKHQVESMMQFLLPPLKDSKLINAMRYSAMAPSKCLRGRLAVYAADLYSVSRDSSLRYAAAIEFVHAFSLIHDDLPSMDNSNMRRGQSSCHLKFDEATAILAGNALMAKAFEIVTSDEIHKNSEIRNNLVTLLASSIGCEGMIQGQMMDIDSEGKTLNLEQLQILQSLKTGKLITASVLGGAILGGASKEDYQALRTYGEALGLLFQLTDDLLDQNSHSAVLGKPTGQDMIAEKATFLSTLGRKKVLEMAERKKCEAITALARFNTRGEILGEIASEVLIRNF